MEKPEISINKTIHFFTIFFQEYQKYVKEKYKENDFSFKFYNGNFLFIFYEDYLLIRLNL